MSKLYAISGVTGMTGNELVRQILVDGSTDRVLGFDNFYASSIETVSDHINDERFEFFEYDLNNREQMTAFEERVNAVKGSYEEIIYINCAAVVHTEHFYHVYETFETNVEGMNEFLMQAIRVGAQKFINCSTSEVYSMNSWNENGGVKESDFLTLSVAEHSQRTSYATGKLLTEFFVKDAVIEGKIKGCSIRFANVYSKDERYPKHIIPFIINSFRDNGKVVFDKFVGAAFGGFFCLLVGEAFHIESDIFIFMRLCSHLADKFNLAGILTTRNGKLDTDNITSMLHNRKYIGEYRYRDIVIPGGIPAIVPE